MPSFKKGILYIVLFFIVIWMFILGILVGRGNSPVEFDTRKFQKKLAKIAGKYETEKNSAKETDIQFYEALKRPMPQANDMTVDKNSVNNALDDPTKGENNSNTEKIENKTESKKNISLKVSQKSLTKSKYSTLMKAKSTAEHNKPAESSKSELKPKRISKEKKEGKLTIQIAAFKDVKGADEKISILKAKGYSAYKTLGNVQDQTWHRVRVGRFSTTEVARTYLRKLKKDNINGIIIKHD
jgi:cell division protein FtsN